MSQTLPYKGYVGSVLYSAEDRLLHGRILGIRDMVNFEGAGVKSRLLQGGGQEAQQTFGGNFKVRISPDLRRRAALYAEEHEMKLNAVVQGALREYLTHAD